MPDPEFKSDRSQFRSPWLSTVGRYRARHWIQARLFGYPCPGCMRLRLIVAYALIAYLLFLA